MELGVQIFFHRRKEAAGCKLFIRLYFILNFCFTLLNCFPQLKIMFIFSKVFLFFNSINEKGGSLILEPDLISQSLPSRSLPKRLPTFSEMSNSKLLHRLKQSHPWGGSMSSIIDSPSLRTSHPYRRWGDSKEVDFSGLWNPL